MLNSFILLRPERVLENARIDLLYVVPLCGKEPECGEVPTQRIAQEGLLVPDRDHRDHVDVLHLLE